MASQPEPPRPPSPARAFAAFLAVVFAVEFVVTLALPAVMPHASALATTVVDALVLAALVAPLVWLLIIRPLRTAATTGQAIAEHVMAHAGDAIVTIDERGVIQTANQVAGQIFGRPAAGLIGAEVGILMRPSDRDEHPGHLLRYLATGEKHVIDRRREVTALRADGTAFPVELSVSELRPAGRRLFAAIIRDVTERRSAEQALRDSEARYRLLFDGNPTPLLLYDPATLRFQAVNDAAVRQYGFTREEFQQLTVAELRPPEDVPQLMEHLASPAVEGMRRGRFRHRRKDGTVFEVDIISHAMEVGGSSARLVIATDVSERADLERQLRQAQKMEAVGQLAGGMAHDFNNLLSTILTTAELMGSELPADSALRDDLETIRTAAGRGVTLTAKLLAFSRRKTLEYQTLAVDELLGDFARVVRRLIPESIELSLTLRAAGARIHADPGAVEQIVMNLVTNARDAMPAGGTLTIGTERATMDEEFARGHAGTRPGDYVVLAVRDTGAGMDVDTLRRVFEPFFTTKPVGVGTGLGMSMVYGLVKQHQGYVDVASQAGAGTAVSVYLPEVAAPPEPVAAEEAPRSAASSGETILLVEDEPALRRAATRVLAKSGYRVLTAADGRDALEMLEQEPRVDLIITDVVMPRLGGNELIRELRERGRRVRVLFTSGYPGRGDEREEMEPGIPFITKPWTIPELLRAVRGALDAPVPGAPTART
jgi:PAS domain S-box-containing protein